MLRTSEEKSLLGRYSSFESVPQTLEKVVTLLLKSERLKRLLYYSDPKALKLPKLTPAQSLQVLQEQIRIVPRLEISEDTKPYILISLTDFIPDDNMTDFRSVIMCIDIICHYDNWKLENFQLRPYSIAGEIDGLLNKSSKTKNGVVDFMGAKIFNVNPYMGGLTLKYLIQTNVDDVRLHPDND